MSDVIALVCAGISLIALVIWLVTYWHGLRANARALAEIRRLNAEREQASVRLNEQWQHEVAQAVAEWHQMQEGSEQ